MSVKNRTPIRTASPALRLLFLYAKQRGLSQKQLAYAAGIEPHIVGRYRRGERTPSVIRVEELADAMGLELTLVPKRGADT